MLALIDGDVLVYRCGFAAQSKKFTATTEDGEFIISAHNKGELKEYVEGIDNVIITEEVLPETLKNATHNVKQALATITHDSGADEYKVFISGSSNFREDVATIRPYKGNRDRNSRPYHYDSLRKYILEHHPSELIEGQEADDAMGIAQTQAAILPVVFDNEKTKEYPTIICTIDKDLKMIAGRHYNWVTKKKEFIDEPAAIRFFYTQLITGDTVDNIVGIPKKGVAAARKILQGLSTEEEYLRAVSVAYAVAYDDPESAMLENARLLWIRRKENELWSLE